MDCNLKRPRTETRKQISAIVLVLFGSLFCGDSFATVFGDGCVAPPSSAQGQTFYVDPVNGNMKNDGSAARPWSTLAEVLDEKNKLLATQAYAGSYEKSDRKLSDRNPTAPIKPGDLIYLKSGDHGNVQITGAINKEFVTIRAADGETPVLRSLRVNSAAKWMFIGLKFQGAGDGSTNSLPGSALIEFGRNVWFGPTTNITFVGNSISTTDDTSVWTDLDWVKKPFLFGILSGATCVAITNNHFFNLRNGLQFDGEQHFVADNKFDNFGNDAINVIASYAVIKNNKITDGRHTKSDPMHPDGIQGWTKNGATNTGVVIDGNTIIKTGDPKVSEMQGIGIFDGKWDGLMISNNVVVTNHWHGISVGTAEGVANVKIINNTVVAHDPVGHPTWILVRSAKDNAAPRNVIIRNNITTRLDYPGEGVTADHNIVAKMIATSAPGQPVYISKPGSYGAHNTIDPGIYDTLRNVDHSKGAYDLRPKPNSPAIGRGNAEFAPATDILGKRRVGSIDIGAYARSN